MFDAAVRWLKHDAETRLRHKQDVLARVRFPRVTRKYLTAQVCGEAIIQDCCVCLKMVMGESSPKRSLS